MLSYSVPVELRNEGEAVAMNFELSLYVDSEKSVTKEIDKLEGGAVVIEKLPTVVAEGKHHIRAVVDEKNVVVKNLFTLSADEVTSPSISTLSAETASLIEYLNSYDAPSVLILF